MLQNRLLTIGKNIQNQRKKQNLTQIELAVEVGIDRAYLSEIENGKANISVNILYAIADALHIDIKDFFNTNQS
ncbi:MAG: helix-turn-helix transcriptional regulator [Alphaproteobacteria bacterium]|nr:helix-turn-helix transcriptional regulator [Alphaproteobacteria bacterium]